MATAGRDSVFTLSFDSLEQYLRNQGFSDTLSLIDTLAALKVRTSTQIHDSLGQSNVVIPNSMTVHNELTVDDTLQIAGTKLYQIVDGKGKNALKVYNTGGLDVEGDYLWLGNNIIRTANDTLDIDGKLQIDDELWINSTSITNPTNGTMSINAPLVSIPSDSTYAGQAVRADSLYADLIDSDSIYVNRFKADSLYNNKFMSDLTMANGAKLSNTRADKLSVTENVIYLNTSDT